MSGRLVVVSGPSGVGKGTVIAELLRRRPDIWLSISTTTRQPRPGEQDGREYFFVSVEEFQRMADSQGFLEWAQYADNLYGTQRRPVDDRISEETSVLLEIDLEGARQVRRNFPEALLVFVAPPELTCDVVAASGQHLGGYIMPGSQLIELALRRDTKRIRYDDSQPVTLDAGNTTAACVSSGIWMALVGAISALQQRYPDHRSILTGGDGQALIDLGIAAEWRPHLVLEGLQLTAGEIATTT